MADRVLTALARTLARHLPDFGVTPGHIYDLTDDDPTPDEISLIGESPVIGFVDPYQLTYDAGEAEEGSRGGTAGVGGNTSDISIVLVLVFIRKLSVAKVGKVQAYARPYARYAIRDCIRAHNTLGGAVWRARAQSAEAGPFAWGGSPLDPPNWYVVRVPIAITDDRQVTPGSD